MPRDLGTVPLTNRHSAFILRHMFATNLKTKMIENDISARKLAAAWRPDNPESGRRNIHKYLAGQIPTDRVAAEIAVALDVPVEELVGSDDEEDIHQMVADLRAQLTALTRAVDRRSRSAA